MTNNSRMPVAYIAGPFRAKNAWLREKNIREAEELALRVAECGVAPLCPHTNTRFFDGTLSDEFWLAATMELLRRSDVIVLTNRWVESSGARAEYEWARDNGLVVFGECHVPGELSIWADAFKKAREVA